MTHKIIKTENYLLVVDDSEMVGKGYRLDITRMSVGIIDDDFLYNARKDWFKKIIAHLPLNFSPVLEGIPLLPPIEDDVEQLYNESWMNKHVSYNSDIGSSFREGYNKAKEKFRYTEEDMRKALLIKHDGLDADYVIEVISNQYPTEFECAAQDKYILVDGTETRIFERKTITTAQGIQWVGKYK